MFADNHNPPHFHIRYGDYDAIITIDEGIVKGSIPRSVLKHIFTWMDLHRDELMNNWHLLQNGKEPLRISPLQ